MRNVYEVLKEKESAIERVRREVEALRLVSDLLVDQGDPKPNTFALGAGPETNIDNVQPTKKRA